MYKNLFYFKYFTNTPYETIMRMYPFEKEILYNLYLQQKDFELKSKQG